MQQVGARPAIDNVISASANDGVGEGVADAVDVARPDEREVFHVRCKRMTDRSEYAVVTLIGRLDGFAAGLIDLVDVIAWAATQLVDAAGARKRVVAGIAEETVDLRCAGHVLMIAVADDVDAVAPVPGLECEAPNIEHRLGRHFDAKRVFKGSVTVALKEQVGRQAGLDLACGKGSDNSGSEIVFVNQNGLDTGDARRICESHVTKDNHCVRACAAINDFAQKNLAVREKEIVVAVASTESVNA